MAEPNKEITKFELYEAAISSAAGSTKFTVDEVGNSLRQAQILREKLSEKTGELPPTGFRSADWTEVISLYIDHGLNLEDQTSVKMLKYFNSQREQTLRQELVSAPRTISQQDNQSFLDNALKTTATIGGVGLLFAFTIYASAEDKVGGDYPMYSQANIRNYAQVPPNIDLQNPNLLADIEKRKVQVRIITEQRNELVSTERANRGPVIFGTLGIGVLGVVGTMILGAAKLNRKLYGD